MDFLSSSPSILDVLSSGDEITDMSFRGGSFKVRLESLKQSPTDDWGLQSTPDSNMFLSSDGFDSFGTELARKRKLSFDCGNSKRVQHGFQITPPVLTSHDSEDDRFGFEVSALAVSALRTNFDRSTTRLHHMDDVSAFGSSSYDMLEMGDSSCSDDDESPSMSPHYDTPPMSPVHLHGPYSPYSPTTSPTSSCPPSPLSGFETCDPASLPSLSYADGKRPSQFRNLTGAVRDAIRDKSMALLRGAMAVNKVSAIVQEEFNCRVSQRTLYNWKSQATGVPMPSTERFTCD